MILASTAEPKTKRGTAAFRASLTRRGRTPFRTLSGDPPERDPKLLLQVVPDHQMRDVALLSGELVRGAAGNDVGEPPGRQGIANAGSCARSTQEQVRAIEPVTVRARHRRFVRPSEQISADPRQR